MNNRKLILNHIDHIVSLVRYVHLKKVLTSVNDKPHLNFWRVIYGGLLDLAVLEWCKLYGANAEPTHWKELVIDHEQFRSDLLTTLNIEPEVWATYWNHMKGYRNEYIAHDLAEKGVDQFPTLDLALESSYFYYDYLYKELIKTGKTNYPEDIREYCERFSAQARVVAEKALEETSGIDEVVY